jgi:hypothetical protein
MRRPWTGALARWGRLLRGCTVSKRTPGGTRLARHFGSVWPGRRAPAGAGFCDRISRRMNGQICTEPADIEQGGGDVNLEEDGHQPTWVRHSPGVAEDCGRLCPGEGEHSGEAETGDRVNPGGESLGVTTGEVTGTGRWRSWLERRRGKVAPASGSVHAAAPAATAHRGGWCRAALAPRRCGNPHHTQSRQQLGQIRSLACRACGCPVGGHERFERVAAVAALIFE